MDFAPFCLCLSVTQVLGNLAIPFEEELLQSGLALSEAHSEDFEKLFGGQFFVNHRPTKGKRKRNRNIQKRSVLWGLDRFYSDAIKAKNHFGGLTKKIGSIFGSDDSQVKDEKAHS